MSSGIILISILERPAWPWSSLQRVCPPILALCGINGSAWDPTVEAQNQGIVGSIAADLHWFSIRSARPVSNIRVVTAAKDRENANKCIGTANIARPGAMLPNL